ncbi:MAG: fimbrillin family protein [Parabacteroides sp.]|nr:fimbrillin family protein [Parabacteroides sp.]
MFLTAGTYTFYALSVNAAGTESDSVPPALAAGSYSETEALKNNIDYLYCAVSNKIISDPDGGKQNVALSFTRLASRIRITVTSKGGTGSEEIIEADAPKITLPLTNPEGSKITLGANDPIGQYPVASDGPTLESTGNLTDGFTAGCILLPMKEKEKIPVRIVFPSITFNGLAAQTDKLYTAEITTPTGGFVSGKQYNYTVNITGNQVGFTGLSIEPWNVNDGQLPNGNITEDFD